MVIEYIPPDPGTQVTETVRVHTVGDPGVVGQFWRTPALNATAPEERRHRDIGRQEIAPRVDGRDRHVGDPIADIPERGLGRRDRAAGGHSYDETVGNSGGGTNSNGAAIPRRDDADPIDVVR